MLVAGVVTAAIVDLRTRRIPNVLTASLAGIGLGLAASGISGVSVLASCGGMLLGLLLMMPGHALGSTGAGDVKLMAAVGAIVGPALIVSAFLFTAVVGGVLAVIVAARRKRLAATVSGAGRLVAAGSELRAEIRAVPASSRFAYGPAIALGSVLAALIG